MTGKRVYKYKVQPREEVEDIHGHVHGAGHSIELHKREYNRLVKLHNLEGEDGNNETTE